MTVKKTWNAFYDAFETYWSLKRGTFALDKQKSLVISVARQYFSRLEKRIPNVDWKIFFDRLADWRTEFVDVTELPSFVNEWYQTQRQPEGPTIIPSFMAYRADLASAAQTCGDRSNHFTTERANYRRMESICWNVDTRIRGCDNHRLFAGRTLEECTATLFDWFHMAGITDAQISEADNEMRAQQIELTRIAAMDKDDRREYRRSTLREISAMVHKIASRTATPLSEERTER